MDLGADFADVLQVLGEGSRIDSLEAQTTVEEDFYVLSGGVEIQSHIVFLWV